MRGREWRRGSEEWEGEGGVEYVSGDEEEASVGDLEDGVGELEEWFDGESGSERGVVMGRRGVVMRKMGRRVVGRKILRRREKKHQMLGRRGSGAGIIREPGRRNRKWRLSMRLRRQRGRLCLLDKWILRISIAVRYASE